MAQATAVQRSEDVLRRFFAEERAGATPRRVDRLDRAEADLRACLDELAPHLLTKQELALVALERQFEPVGATARVAGAEALLLTLPRFLDEPRWHGEDLEDRRLRIALAEPLAEEIVRLPALRNLDLDLGRAWWIVVASVRHEIFLLRQERAAAREG